MTKKRLPKITLGDRETIIAVVPEYCRGPGWANSPVWIYIADWTNKTFRSECIQPEDQTNELRALFNVGSAAHKAMLDAVREYVE